MQYSEVQAAASLSNLVTYFWKYEHQDEDIVHTILPDTYFDLIADFEHGILQQVHLTGIWTKPIDVVVTKGTVMFAIRFKMLAAEYLFQREIKSLLNTTTSLPLSFWSIDTLSSTNFETFVEMLTAQMESVIGCTPTLDSRKVKLFNLIYKKEQYSIHELSDAVGWSSRQINRYFNQQVGIPLKTFINMVRCKASYPEIATGNLAPSSPYFDQSHFIKEVKRYTGATPQELSKNKNGRFLQLSTLAKK